MTDSFNDGGPATAPRFGFNLIGFLTSNMGLGVVARNIAKLMMERGYAVTGFNVDAGLGRDRLEIATGLRLVERIEDLPHEINVVVLAGVALVQLRLDHPTFFGRPGRIDAVVHFWELPTLPPRWLPTLNEFDVIVAMSDFIASAHRFALSGPAVIDGRTPIELPASPPADRSRFGLPRDAVVFVTSFEPHSDSARKNPHAVVSAFRAIAETNLHAWLVVKFNNATLADGSEHPVVGDLETLRAGHERIRLLREPMRYTDVISLYATCDVFVSLHRAEGLGLGMAEAMLLGKPVVATGWSGNLTFMDHTNAALVRYRLVRVRRETGSYRESYIDESTVWAEPDVEHATEWMRALAGDAALRKRIGAAAAARMEAENAEARDGRFLEELRCVAEQRRTVGKGRSHRCGEPADDALVVSRLARIQSLERELAWIKSRPSFRVADAMKRTLASALKRRKPS